MPRRRFRPGPAAPLLACLAILAAPPWAGATPPGRIVQLAQDGGGPQGTIVARYGHWNVAVGELGGKICYAISAPIAGTPGPTARARAYMMIATSPAKKQYKEISVLAARAFRPGAPAVAAIGERRFALFTKADGAWVRTAAEEPVLLETMLQNTRLVISGTAADGEAIRDTYALDGLAKAVERVAQECR